MQDDSKPKKQVDPPRMTIGQAIAIALLLIVGFIALENGQSLVFLVMAMGVAAFLLNRLFALVLWWATRNDDAPKG